MKDYKRYRNPEERKEWKRKYNKRYRQLHPPDGDKERKRNKRLKREKKRRAVEFLGGKCSKCGYKKCLGVLVFHHPEGVKKEPINSIMGRKWERIKDAIKDCVLLCSNCHRELHYET